MRLSQTSSQGRFERPELDVLRFFAFTLVFVHHAAPFPHSNGKLLSAIHRLCVGGGFGVDLFFVLSAYLITELLRREKIKTGKIELKAFYMRRILRIWPLYYLFLFSVAFFSRHTQFAISTNVLLAYSLLVGNWYCATSGFIDGPAGPLWSVSIEEQFYIAWPLLLQALSRRAVMVLSAGLFVIAEIVKLYLLAEHPIRSTIWTNTFARMDTIAIGVLAAYLLNGRVPKIAGAIRTLLFGLGLTCLYVAVTCFHVMDNGIPVAAGLIGYMLGLLAAIAFFLSFLGATIPAMSSKGIVGLRFLGKVSYGLYVFHMFAIEMWAPPRFATLHTVPALITAIVLASISYVVLEKPFLRLKGHFTRVGDGPVEAIFASKREMCDSL